MLEKTRLGQTLKRRAARARGRPQERDTEASASAPRCVLVAGWFSLRGGGATAGDLITADVVCRWLEDAGYAYDVALGHPFNGGVDWLAVDPARYSDVVLVCGPVSPDLEVGRIVQRFKGRRLHALNVSMVAGLASWQPFDVLIERDSGRVARPDLAFADDSWRVPVVGLLRVHAQPEYARHMHAVVDTAIDEFLREREVAVIPIDTRLDVNAQGLRSAREVASTIARMDLVVTTRLHGMVFALKGGVPAVVVDPVAGGAKVRRQAQAIGWPCMVTADRLDTSRLEAMFEYCRTDEARTVARDCASRAAERVDGVREDFLAGLGAAAHGA